MSDQAADTAGEQTWTPAAVHQLRSSPQTEEIDPAALAEAARQQGHAAGFDAGYAEGIAGGRALAENIAEEMGTLLASMAAPYRELDAAIMADLVAVVERATRAAVRRELQLQPADIKALLREALAVLGDAQVAVQVALHPQDAALCREAGLDGDAFTLVEDASLQRGGAQLRSASSFVDASVEARLEAVFEQFREATGLPAAAGETE